MSQGEPTHSTPAPVAAVAVRLPPYWDRNQRVWFLQVESQFHLAHITSQERKYHHNPYDQLKAALLQRTEASERTRWQQLLSAEEPAAPLNLAGLAGLAYAVMEVSSPSITTATALTSQSAGNTSTTARDIRKPNASQYNVDDLCHRLEQVVLAATRLVFAALHHADQTTTARVERSLFRPLL
ncbi:hypothetical protein HPB47_020462 [Ixodes persulcatus]|uniref:Uncharacterized protein n=1 Tax=Ixodes persulcatus TaxID=34615 RepID=A0AC60QGA3_IXOPE|nr:hypothetical protein HPB47_020462 [Ixodes persulcatus]